MAHVLAGLLVILALIVWMWRGLLVDRRSAAVSIGALYWHFVDVVWLTVFFTFYLTPYLS
jgi:heme/copper-type cytochrome/quinol oxidase subunit 3